MTPASIIGSVRRLIQDNQLLRTASEYSDATLLEFVNQTLQQTATLRPDLFAYLAEITPDAGNVAQVLPADSVRLIEVLSVTGVSAIIEVNYEAMNRNYPGWVSEAPGTPINYMRHIRNPNRFFLYPAPAEGLTLTVEYVQSPPDYGLNDEIALLPAAFKPAIVYGTTSLIHEMDGQNNSQEKSDKLHKKFESLLGVNMQSRSLTDLSGGGISRDKVV